MSLHVKGLKQDFFGHNIGGSAQVNADWDSETFDWFWTTRDFGQETRYFWSLSCINGLIKNRVWSLRWTIVPIVFENIGNQIYDDGNREIMTHGTADWEMPKWSLFGRRFPIRKDSMISAWSQEWDFCPRRRTSRPSGLYGCESKAVSNQLDIN